MGKPLRQTVDQRHHLVAARHGESSARTKVILDVDREKNVAFTEGAEFSHDTLPSANAGSVVTTKMNVPLPRQP
jgi:hypothetical protein